MQQNITAEDKRIAGTLQKTIRYVPGDRVLAYVRPLWRDAVIERAAPGWGFNVYVDAPLYRHYNLRRAALIPLVNAPEWKIEFKIGDFVNFDPFYSPKQWGKIISIGDQQDGEQEYEILTTGRDFVRIPEDYIWGEKEIEGVRPVCPICLEHFDNATRISILDCGHLHCETCANAVSNIKELIPRQLNCGVCDATFFFPLTTIRLRFNEFENVICVRCNLEITDDMHTFLVNGRLQCCFCMPGAAADVLGHKQIFLSLE